MVSYIYFFICFLAVYSYSGELRAQEKDILFLDLVPDTKIRLDNLNSPYRETNPCLTPDGRFLFFMSGRGGQAWNDPAYTSYQGQTEADGDIYYSQKTRDGWSDPVNMGPSVNSSMGEDEPNVTPDGQYVIFQSWKEGWDTTGGPYYISELSGNSWGAPKGLGGNIHRFFMDEIEKNDWYYATDGSAISPDGTIFIFASGKWYMEPMDLYMSVKSEDGWSYPEKLPLCTDADERSVFIAADSRTLFFSSSGYTGYGGLDIFKTVIDKDGNHSDIINLGSAFNTKEDDFGFTMNLEGTEIFYTRNAELFNVKIRDPDHLLKPLPTLVINGVVSDYSGNPIEAEIRIISKQTDQAVARARSNAITGEYSLAIRKVNDTYIKHVTAENFRNYTEEINITNSEASSVRNSRDLLKRINSDLVFFDFDDPDIRNGEINKLDSIIDYLFANKRSRILLTGHADQPGTENYNLELSKKRVENVKKYLVDRGIPARIIRTVYAGESQPLESHPEGEKSQVNRRVEVLIIPLD